jgi:RNA polymerase sigma-70 factor (ECF subfamily)
MKEAFVKPKTQEAAEAFGRIVHQHQKAVFAVAYGKLRNVHDAEDVMQEVFIEAYRNYHNLKKPEKVSAWLFTATKYRCNDHIRRKSRREKRERAYAGAHNLSSDPSTESQVERERHHAVLKAIGSLPEKFRLIIMLKHFARLSYADISKMTGLSKTTIDGRLRTAKEKLGQKLVDMGIEVS